MMGNMSKISMMCEDNDLESLTIYIGSERIAREFIEAHRKMRDSNEPAFKQFNKIHDKMQGK